MVLVVAQSSAISAMVGAMASKEIRKQSFTIASSQSAMTNAEIYEKGFIFVSSQITEVKNAIFEQRKPICLSSDLRQIRNRKIVGDYCQLLAPHDR
eukprot:scaffold7730_cov173-Ochromonas_danica.AAC.7